MASSFQAALADAARTHGECTVCLEPRSLTLAVLCDVAERRVCRHFLCMACATQLQTRLCPICRARFHAPIQLPSPHQDAARLFRLIDASGDARVSRDELTDYCAAFTGVSADVLNAAVGPRWAQWDTDADGLLDPDEFQARVLPVLAELHDHERDCAAIPSLFEAPDAWFAHWDEDKSGELDLGELLRALSKTFVALEPLELVGILEALWPLFDADGSATIDSNEFTAGGGLLEMLQANLGGMAR
jgi:Ca2+-binding EF-hand superfamily protein